MHCFAVSIARRKNSWCAAVPTFATHVGFHSSCVMSDSKASRSKHVLRSVLQHDQALTRSAPTSYRRALNSSRRNLSPPKRWIEHSTCSTTPSSPSCHSWSRHEANSTLERRHTRRPPIGSSVRGASGSRRPYATTIPCTCVRTPAKRSDTGRRDVSFGRVARLLGPPPLTSLLMGA